MGFHNRFDGVSVSDSRNDLRPYLTGATRPPKIRTGSSKPLAVNSPRSLNVNRFPAQSSLTAFPTVLVPSSARVNLICGSTVSG